MRKTGVDLSRTGLIPKSDGEKAERRLGDEKRTERKGKVKEEVVARASKGLNPLPEFCKLGKIFRPSDLTCYLQGYAMTAGFSNSQEPFKHVYQRTMRRCFGATRGTRRGYLGGKQEKKAGRKRGIIFRKKELAPTLEMNLSRG